MRNNAALLLLLREMRWDNNCENESINNVPRLYRMRIQWIIEMRIATTVEDFQFAIFPRLIIYLNSDADSISIR